MRGRVSRLIAVGALRCTPEASENVRVHRDPSPAQTFSSAPFAPMHQTLDARLLRAGQGCAGRITSERQRAGGACRHARRRNSDMDKSSLIGVIIGVVCLGIVFFEVSHGNLLMFYSLEGVLMVGGGSISVCFMGLPLEKIKAVPGYIRRFLFHKGRNAVDVVQTMAALGEKARRDGILALEPEIEKLQTTDPFLASGLRMAVDGVDPDGINSTLRMEIMAMQDRHKYGKKFFDLIKLYGPGWGLVGTLVGQVGMSANRMSAAVCTLVIMNVSRCSPAPSTISMMSS